MNKHAKACIIWNDWSTKEVCICKNLGKHQKHALEFYENYPGWHSFSKTDGITKRVIKSPEKRGLLQVNEYGQARAYNQ